jgi:multicomponent Na+:H+ antiporter subunit D
VREHLPILVVTLPLLAAVVAPIVGLFSVRLARLGCLAALVLSHLCALGALAAVLANGTWRYELGGWPAPWGIEYVVDALGGVMAVLVSFLAVASALHMRPLATGGRGIEPTATAALHSLLAAGLLGIVLTGDAFNLYVFLEISSLSAYALLAGGEARGLVAVFRYLLLGTIAASFYLLGLGYLYALTGTLNMADLASRLPAVAGSAPAGVGLALIVTGLAIKVALFPLHGWLPDTYTYAPSSVAAFVASAMSKVGAYALLRLLFFVFGADAAGRALDVLAVAAAVAMVAGSAMAVLQRDLRRMLAYSSVGHMGYVVLGLGLGNAAGLVGALLHALNHAAMKACLFMAAGNVFRARTVLVSDWTGVSRRRPLTLAAFTVAAVSMIGLPPTGGFFSKWYLVQGALERGRWPFVAAIVASSLLTAVYMFRVLETAYFRDAPERAAVPDEAANGLLEHERDAPVAMLLPVVALGAAVLALGAFNQPLVEHVLAPALAGVVR